MNRSDLAKRTCVLALVAGLAAGGLAATGCSKEEKKAAVGVSGRAGAAEVTAAVKDDLVASLVSRIPDDALGFLVWEGSHPAYAKLSASPWGNSSGITELLKNAEGEAKAVIDTMKQVGLDPSDKATWEAVFSEAVFYFTPPAEGVKKPNIGVLFKSKDAGKLNTLLSTVKSEATKHNQKVGELKLAAGTGFSLAGPQAEGELIVASDNGVASIATTQSLAEQALASKGGKTPLLMTTPAFLKASAGFPVAAKRFATGYVDVEKTVQAAAKSGAKVDTAAMEAFPVSAIALALSMDETPETSLRLVYDDAKVANNPWLKSLNSSVSKSFASVLPTKPLLVLSVDGKMIKDVKEAMLAGLGEMGALYSQQLAFLDDVKRIGIAASVAPMGQSLLPVPDLMIVAESSDAEKTKNQLQSILGMAMMSSGMPGMTWQDKQIEGTAVKSMMAPMGMGLFLTSTNGLVVATSSEPVMKNALASKSGFASALPKRGEQVFSDVATVSNLYLNFEEIGSYVESMGGMVAMYAPPGQDASKFLNPENIQAIKKMGTMIGAVTIDKGIIGVDSFYQQPAA